MVRSKLERKNDVDKISDILPAFNNEPQKEVILEGTDEGIQNVIRRFGADGAITSVDKYSSRIRVMVHDSPAFYGWVFGFNGDLRIVEPKEAVKKYRKMLRRGFK